MRTALVAISLWLFGSAALAGAVDFDTDVVPILTKAGCNTGACHGAAAGRGEFRLSLYGSDPGFDYRSIVEEFEGRRINPARPDASLILLKGMESISHGGGDRLDYDGADAKTLETWIADGAPRLHQRHLIEFDVAPAIHVADAVNQPANLRANARFDDGLTRDVTPWTVFTAEDDSAVKLNAESQTATVLRGGRHVVIARYLDRVVPLILMVPLSPSPIDLADVSRRNFIDDRVYDLLTTLRIPPSPPADDAIFLRRASLDFTGRLPSPERVRAFLDDNRSDKRERLIDELLASEEFNDYWTYEFAKLLRIRSQPQDSDGARTYHAWLRDQIAKGTPYDEIARALVTASGDSHVVGPANFYRTTGGPREQAEFVSELLLGSRLRCANCHNHPLDRWTQDDYHGLAAVFARVRPGQTVAVATSGDVIHPRTGEPALPRIPGERFLSDQADGRAAFAEWLTDPGNPYFARAIVNRLWKHLMGRGLVEPADDLRDTNPATHPELLQDLADDFVSHGYKLRRTLRLIATSDVYARSQETQKGNENDDRYYSHFLIRPLEPEVLADALADVTGVAMEFGDEPAGTRAVTLFDPKIPSPELDVLGRCDRSDSCESTQGAAGGLPRMLHQFNGPLVNVRITDPEGRLSRAITKGTAPMAIVQEFYLRALSRPPSDAETEFWRTELNAVKSPRQQREVLQDFVWSLCTCREFTTNH